MSKNQKLRVVVKSRLNELYESATKNISEVLDWNDPEIVGESTSKTIAKAMRRLRSKIEKMRDLVLA